MNSNWFIISECSSLAPELQKQPQHGGTVYRAHVSLRARTTIRDEAGCIPGQTEPYMSHCAPANKQGVQRKTQTQSKHILYSSRISNVEVSSNMIVCVLICVVIDVL